MTENVIVRPLGKITGILADCGLEVTYAYDDLVFVQHSAFLLQFTDQPAGASAKEGENTALKLFINTECEPSVAEEVQENLVEAHTKQGYSLLPSGNFTISQNDDETVNLTFS